MTRKRRQFGATLAIALVLTPLMTPIVHGHAAQVNVMPTSTNTPKVEAPTGVDHPFEHATTELAPGVTDEKESFLNPQKTKNNHDVMHTVSVDLSKNATIRAGVPDDGTKTGLQTVRDEANAAIKNGHQVVAAGNADFFNMSSGKTSGAVIKDGREIQAPMPGSNEGFFGLTKAGKPVIGEAADYAGRKGDLQQALGGLGRLVKDGVVQDKSKLNALKIGTEHSARSAVGIKDDGTVFFVSIDGQQPPYSDGMTLGDLADLMKAKGAKDALNFDGGGSTTYVARTPGEQGLSLQNRPSDREERKISSSWQVVTNVKSDHKLDRAEISPKSQAYLPNAVVDFKAKGVDGAGYAATLPNNGLTWELADKSFGTLEANGTFKSTGKIGEVVVKLKQGSKLLGQSTVTITNPTRLSFASSELSLGMGEKASLRLQAYAGERHIHTTADDIKWEYPKSLGTITGFDNLQAANQTASGDIVASLKHNEALKDTVNVQVGQLPKTIADFEDGVDDWIATAGFRGETATIDSVDKTNGLVRFGNKALKLNFDYTTGKENSTLGAYAGPKELLKVPSAPKALGMWVYGTPEAKGNWIRMAIHDANGVATPLDFVDTNTGIDWTGWKYIEAPIPAGTAYPISIDAKLAIRLMSVRAGQPGAGPFTKGYIFADNIRAVYGVNKDDLTNPIIDSIDSDDQVFTNSDVKITTKLRDDPNDPNVSGIDWSKSAMSVDGKDYSKDTKHFSHDKDGSMTLSGLTFMNGSHHVHVTAVDNFGNQTEKDSYFTVKSDQKLGIHLNQIDKSTKLGGTVEFTITADDLTKFKEANLKIKLSPALAFQDIEYSKSSNANVNTIDSKTNTLFLNLKDLGTDESKPLATVILSVPRDTPANVPLTYQLIDGSAVTLADSDPDTNQVLTTASNESSVKAEADYHLKHTPFVSELSNVVTVLDEHEQPVANADVFIVDAKNEKTVLGKTDTKGEVPIIPMGAGKYQLGADKGSFHSFMDETIIYNPGEGLSAIPSHLLAGGSQDPTTRKTITWMTKPTNDKLNSLMQIATDDEYMAKSDQVFTTKQGHNSLFTYDGDTSAVTVNRVDASKLKPGTSYAYRVGDGKNWSEVRHFTTLKKQTKFSFNVFGDTQVGNADQLTAFDKFLDNMEMSKNKPVFGIHVGDFNDDQTLYTEADVTAQIFDKHPYYSSLDMLHVMGNHEYMGDDGSKSIEMLGIPNGNGPKTVRKGTYSVDYGNMHIASIGWTDNPEEMQYELDWLKKDMAATKQTWRIVTTHQPAYNKNPADARSTMFNKMLPPVCDELGIDVVFSGHDHSYGRTFPLVGGKKAAKGTTYIAAGHTGLKTYDIRPNQPEVWDMIQSGDNKAQKTFLTLSVDDNKMTLLTVDDKGQQVDAAKLTARNHSETSGSSENGGSDSVNSSSKPNTADRLDLVTVIEDADKITIGDYTTESFKAFKAALVKAKQVLANPNATEIEIMAANKALVKAQSALKRVNTNTTQTTMKKIPDKVIAVKGVALYRKPNFSKHVKMNSFSKMPQMHQAQFKVLGIIKANNGRLRFHVRDINRQSKTYKQKGYITTAKSFVQSANYTSIAKNKQLTVINPEGLNGYKSSRLMGEVKRHYHQGRFLKVKHLIHQGTLLAFQLTDGNYVTTNKQRVQVGRVNLPKVVKTKHRIALYRETELIHRKQMIGRNVPLEIMGWDYSNHGTLRYRIAGGYITANHHLVK